jgi:hypothetical protein
MELVHLIGIRLIELESRQISVRGLGGYTCDCSKNCSKYLHSLKAKEEHEKN